MCNYIKAELYNFFCAKKISWIFLILLSAFMGISSCFLTIPIIAPISSAANSIIMLNSLNNLFPVPLIIAVNYFCSAYKNGLFKNNIAYGLKRRNIYIGKFIIGLLLLTLFWLCVASIFTSTIIFKFGFPSMQTSEFISNLKIIKIGIIDSYIYLAIIHALLFIIKNTIIANIISYIAPSFIKLFMNYISSNLKIPADNDVLWHVIAIIIWGIGLRLFRKSEIK